MFGKKYLGIVRGTFIIDGGGKLTHEWRDIKDVTGHAADVLKAVRKISQTTREEKMINDVRLLIDGKFIKSDAKKNYR